LSVVDIGSNSVRLVIYEGAVRSPTPIFNERLLCGLGRTLASTGCLAEESIEQALKALVRFRAINTILGVKNVRAIATAACREAANGAEFIARAEEALGERIRVLSGRQEAELAAMGLMMGFRSPEGFAADLGGGSLEVLSVGGAGMMEAATLPLGGLRLIDASGGNLERAMVIAGQEIARIPWLGKKRGQSFYAVGGVWRAIARLHMAETDYPLRVMHGYAIEPGQAIAFCERIRKVTKLSSLKGIAEVSRKRREVLPYGALVLECLLTASQPREVLFSVFGIREGLLFSLLSEQERSKDPLIAFCTEFARLRSRSAEHAQELCVWTDKLFEAPGPSETPEERRLRHAACLLSDIAWRAHPDYRGEQSLNIIGHAALGGIDHPGRMFLALAVYFRHVGPGGEERQGELSERLIAAVPPRLLERARILGAAVRVAHMLSVGRAGVIDEIRPAYESNKLVLSLPKAYAALDGERLRRRFAALAELLGREPELRVAR
jgi:exopolyphosphatase/guanosine-5'-triphosphate,3'-diphosphate pyrophosphatase